MPLFMDLHQAADYEAKPTMEAIKRNHIADLQVQSKYGVRFLQYWINEEAGLVFCLMEAPDKEACAAVHQEAHGNMPCNVIELKGGDYKALMGEEGRVNAFDIAENAAGELDAGYRTLLMLDLISLASPNLFHETVGSCVLKHGGRPSSQPGHRELFAFTSAPAALQCAVEIRQALESRAGAEPYSRMEFHFGLSSGQPVTHQNGFFEAAIQLANRLCTIAQPGQILISALSAQLIGSIGLQSHEQETALKILDPGDEQFLHLLLDNLEPIAYETDFSLDTLCRKIGFSRSRLYRRITALTGRSANDFIQELRLQKAFHFIRNRQGNITQIAFEAGYSNPSYFARSFQKRFGILPLQLLKADTNRL
jgi:AraC-like DNA-binding protein